MEKKINMWYLLIIFFIVIIGFAAYKNLSNHHEKEYLVVNNRILESADECYLKKDCEGKITLSTLYDKKYLDVQIDPVTKEDINKDLCIEYKNNKAIFCEK